MKEKIWNKIYDSKRNLMIHGDMSTGKTTNINYHLLEKMINHEENFLFLDPKQEYLHQYYERLKKENYNIWIINLSDAKKSEGYNPLEYPYQLYKQNKIDETIKYLEQLSKDLFVDDNYDDPFWENSARSLFIGLVLNLYEDAKENEIHLASVSSILKELDSKVNDVKEYFRAKDKNGAVYTCVSSTIFAPEETKGGIISLAKQKLRPFVDREYLNLLLSETTFSLMELYQKNIAIFLICEEEDTELTPLLSVIISQLYYYLAKQKLKNSFNFILDNFDMINHFSNIKEILSSSISKNIKFILTTRDKKRLEEKYSDYLNKISNDIEITEQEIIVKINGEITCMKNEKVSSLSSSQVVYPILKNKTLNIFNIKNCF